MMTAYILKLIVLVPLVAGLAFGALWLWRKAQGGMSFGQRERAVKLVDARGTTIGESRVTFVADQANVDTQSVLIKGVFPNATSLRAAQLDTQSEAIANRRGYTRDYGITPRLLLVHSFAHAIIRQISIECGYSSSALRERLYVAEQTNEAPAMNGVLIYTGSPDSEGSLGGLVRLATPELLEPIVMRTLEGAGWCGSDPVCLETEPSLAGERVSGAACHCCLLLPETACEKFNRELRT